MKKKTMILAVCLLLVGMLAVNGTLAQTVEDIFVSITTALGLDAPQRDESKLNVALASYYRQGGSLVEGTQAQALVPMGGAWSEKVIANVGGAVYQLWETGAVDKFTAVENLSPEKDAYFRIAFAVDANIFDKLKLNFNITEESFVWEKDWRDVTTGGRPFKMMVATYTEALAPGQISPPALLQVAMDKSATNEDYAKIGSDFLQIKVMAVDADALVTDDQTPRPSAVDTLDATVPLNDGFNPF